MDIITEQLYLVQNLLNKSDYNGVVKIVDSMQNINNENLNKYLKILMELLSLITSLNREQIDTLKEINIQELKLENPSLIFPNITKENEKINLIFARKYDELKNDFRNWDRNIYQDILKKLILLASAKEKKNNENILKLIENKNYERAKILLENRALRHRTEKEEKLTLILLEKLIVLQNSKTLPEINFEETDNYIEAIKNNNFELALHLIKKYNRDNNILLSTSQIYLLLRDIRDLCKTLKNTKIYEEYCSENQVMAFGDSGNLIKNKYEEIKKYGIATIKCKSKERVAKILKDLINYHNIEGIVIDNGKTIVLKYSKTKDINNKIPKMLKKANKLSAKKETKEALHLYLEILKFENTSSIVYSKLGLCFFGLKSYDKAIEYFNIAMELGKKEGKVYDFHSLINSLQGKIQKDEIKPIFKPKDNEFNFEENYNFGLGDISEITDAIILMELNVDEACQKLLINREETELIKLVYAREFFSKGEIKLGEKFLKAVEQNENKTPRVVAALEEVKRSKRMYINKKENTLELSLKLKP